MAASGALHEPRRLGVLDGLRGIAVLLVLWYHIWEISWLQPPPALAFVPATGFFGRHALLLFERLCHLVPVRPRARFGSAVTRRGAGSTGDDS